MASNQKYSRCKNSPSHKRYNMENRAEVNAAKKQKRNEKAVAKKAARKVAVKGLTRQLRRKEWMFSIGGMWENLDRVSFQKYEAKQS
jgi:hypothetical protein